MTVMSLDDLKKLPPLTESELNILDHAKPVFSDDCPEMNEEELKQFRPWYDRQKKTITIDVDIYIVNYFKKLSSETGVSYQELMNMYLLQCVKEEKRPMFS